MKIVKIIGAIFVVIIAAASIWTAVNFNDIKKFFPMASGAFSKFMCSCMFVEGRSEEECKNWSRLALPVSDYSIDNKNRIVRAKAYSFSAVSKYKGEKLGCTLE